MQTLIDAWLDTLAAAIKNNFWLAPLLALAAGVLTSFTPCSISTIPLVIGFVGGVGTEPKKAFRLSLTFAAGSALTFTALGVAASALGRLLPPGMMRWWYLALGALMVLMALQNWGIINLIPSSYLMSKNKRKGYAGAFIAGVLGGVFSSPCATPVLVALLAVVAGQGNVFWGALLLLLYGIGAGTLAVVTGTSVGLVKKLSAGERYGKISKALNILMGAAILAIGLYMFYLGF